jgi:hypothetical protein
MKATGMVFIIQNKVWIEEKTSEKKIKIKLPLFIEDRVYPSDSN